MHAGGPGSLYEVYPDVIIFKKNRVFLIRDAVKFAKHSFSEFYYVPDSASFFRTTISTTSNPAADTATVNRKI